jgi:hypothetical protein
MKINASEFWEEIGTVFNNPEDIIAEEYNKYDDTKSEFTLLKKGTYLIVDKDSHGYRLYDIDKGKNVFFEAGWLDDDIEFETIHTPPLEVLELALESITKTIMNLTSEGWEINPDNQYFDLTPEIKKLQTIQATIDLIKHTQTEQE